MTNRQRRSMLCPNCGKLISVDEPRCPHCGMGRPGSWWKSNTWTRGFRSADQVVRAIIYVNVVMYGISLLLYPREATTVLSPFSLLSPDSRSLVMLGATGTVPIDQLHRWWSLLSANYLHGSIWHILFNMLAFRHLGNLIIEEYGIYRLVILYTLGGVSGFLVSYAAGVHLTIGASASVCSLIGAILYFGRSRGGAYGQAVYRQIGGWALGIFLFGFFMPGINNWAHGGGMAAGFVLGFLLGYREKRRETFYQKALAGACTAATLAILVWAVVSSLLHRFLG